MALIKCPNCGCENSDITLYCKCCGYSIRYIHEQKDRELQKIENMSVEIYKRLIRECLITKFSCSEQYTEQLMSEYRDGDFEGIIEEKWPPLRAASAMLVYDSNADNINGK